MAHPRQPGTMPTMETVPVLFNCLRRERDVFVRIDGQPVPLPRGPKPVLIDTSTNTQPIVVTVAPDDPRTIELTTSEAECDATISLPPPMDGALFLVDPETLMRLPDRDDLVTPASYEIDFDGDDNNGANPIGRMRTYLVAVHHRIHPVAAGAPNANLDDLDYDD